MTKIVRTLLTVSAAARRLGVSPKTVRQWSDAGDLPCERTAAGYRMYSLADLDAFQLSRVQRLNARVARVG